MKSTAFLKTDTGAVTSAISDITTAASGAKPEDRFAEDDSSLQFEKLKQKAISSVQSPKTTEDYMNAILQQALYRDAVYSHETRGFLRALGTHNAVRSRYEALRANQEARGCGA